MALKDYLEVECQNCREKLGKFTDGSFTFANMKIQLNAEVTTLKYDSEHDYDWESKITLTCPECNCTCQVISDMLPQEREKYNIGDKVVINSKWSSMDGKKGVVCKDTEEKYIGVSVEGCTTGHNCYGSCKQGTGYWFSKNEIKKSK